MSKSVLVIDDDSELIDVISAILASEGYPVHCASSGEEGIAAAREKSPGAVLLDWQMPVFSGKEVLAEFETQPDLRAIPMILMSAHLESIPTESLERHLHICKPFDMDELLGRVKQALAHPSQDPAGPGAGIGSSSGRANAAQPELPL